MSDTNIESKSLNVDKEVRKLMKVYSAKESEEFLTINEFR